MDQRNKTLTPALAIDERAEADLPTFEQAVTAALFELRTYARRWTNDWPSAEDLLQRAAERALNARSQFTRGTSAAAWLRTIIRNLAIDEIRHQRHIRTLEASYEHAYEVRDPLGAEDVPEEAAVSRPDIADVRRAVDQLEEPRKTIFLLRMEEELTYRELSERTGVPVGTIGSNLERARRTIRHLLRHGSVPDGRASARRVRRKCRR